MKSPADSPDLPGRSPADQAPKGCGKLRLLTLGNLDRRTLAAKRAKQLIDAIEADLGGGDRLTEGERQLVQRAAVLGAYIESCEVKWLGGEAVELADYLAAINAQRRVLMAIGLERRARNVVPSVAEYVDRIREKGAA
jgi:hypothetical protein